MSRQTNSEFTLDQLKSFLTQLEAQKQSDKNEEETKAYYSSRAKYQKKPEEKCQGGFTMMAFRATV